MVFLRDRGILGGSDGKPKLHGIKKKTKQLLNQEKYTEILNLKDKKEDLDQIELISKSKKKKISTVFINFDKFQITYIKVNLWYKL